MTAWRTRATELIALAAGSAAVLWVLWGPVISHTAEGGSLRLCLKNYYVSDQYAVLSIARQAQDGLPVYREPFSGTGSSVYPSEYYRILGATADMTGTSVIWAWNVVGVLVSLGLLAISIIWARRLAPGTRAWVLAPVPFLIGTLLWWGTGEWLYSSGQAVLWPAFASLYSPGAEGPALLVTGLALILLATWLARSGRRSLPWAAGAGLATGFTLQLHANVAVLAFVATTLALLCDALRAGATPRRRAVVGAGAAVLLVAGLLTPQSGVTIRVGLLVAAILAVLLSDARWRRERGPAAALWVGAAFLASLPLSVRLAAQTLSGEGYLYERQASVAGADTDLPIWAVLVLLLPIWALAGATWWRLTRARDAHPGWLPLLAGLVAATLLLTAGGRLGAEGLEWHRFVIYGMFLIAMAATPGLWLMLTTPTTGSERWAGAAVALALVATLPTTAAFVDAQRGVITCTPPQEAEAFTAIGRVAGDRLVLVDRCFSPGPLRVVSGVHLASFNAGIAVPPDRDATTRALLMIQEGRMPPDDLLLRIGVTGFLTNTQCAGVPRDEVSDRFGEPYARIALRDGEELGLPPGLVYELYDVPGRGESGFRDG
jgi:hypothetical protein